jgi:SAM-dependent methyltransferase
LTDRAVLPCPICGSSAGLENQFEDIRLHRCPSCDHCFTDPDSLEHVGVYDKEWESLHSNWFANPNVALFDYVAQVIERRKRAASVIDIGAGRGELLTYLRNRDPELSLTGIDIALEPDIDGVEVLREDVIAVDFGGRRWDVAVSLATIEHLADVQEFAERLRSLLVPGGLAIVSTNNERSVPYDVARALRKVGYAAAFERLYDRHHLNHFNPTSLKVLMERSRFTLLELRRHNIPLAAVDMPRESRVLRAGVWGTFALGRLTGRTFFQTVVAVTE